MQTLVLEKSRGKMALAVLGSVAFVALGFWMEPQPGRAHWIGLMAIAVFGVFGVIGLAQLIKGGRLVLDEKGFTHTGVLRTQFTPWGDVEDFYLQQMSATTKLIGWNAREGRQKQSLMHTINGSLGAANWVPSGWAATSTEKLYGELTARLEASRR